MAAPLYLYTGPEFGEREDAIIEIKKSLKKKYGSVDEHLFYLVETPFNQVMTILQSGTLFSDAICIVCKNAELLKKKDDLQMISDWLESAEETAVLILVSDEISVDAKLTKLVPFTTLLFITSKQGIIRFVCISNPPSNSKGNFSAFPMRTKPALLW